MNDSKNKKIKLSQDQMIKELIRDYPVDALEYFKPEIIKKYGQPVKITFHMQENSKYSHFDPKMINDIAILFEFQGGEKVVLSLVEHWSDKYQFDIHRLAKYLIDLDKQYPGYEKIPIVLFTDSAGNWRKHPQQSIEIKCLDEVYLTFSYRLVRLKADEAEKHKKTLNKFVAVLRSAMKWDRKNMERKVLFGVDFMRRYGYLETDMRLFRKHIDVIAYFADLTIEQHGVLLKSLDHGKEGMMQTFTQTVEEIIEARVVKRVEAKVKKQVEAKVKKQVEAKVKKQVEARIEKRVEQGYKDAKLADARKMYQKGYPVKDILEITELKRKDLVDARIINR
ncbi:MAG: hypothetical protein GY754_03155 [bacterium]|nr:hypothetical protein [bacterium]